MSNRDCSSQGLVTASFNLKIRRPTNGKNTVLRGDFLSTARVAAQFFQVKEGRNSKLNSSHRPQPERPLKGRQPGRRHRHHRIGSIFHFEGNGEAAARHGGVVADFVEDIKEVFYGEGGPDEPHPLFCDQGRHRSPGQYQGRTGGSRYNRTQGRSLYGLPYL